MPLLILFVILSLSESCLAEYEALVDRSLGYSAIGYAHRTHLGMQLDTLLVDGNVTSNPGSTVTYDRTVLSYSKIDFNLPVHSRLGLNFSFWGKTGFRKQEGALPPRKLSTEVWSEGRLKFGGTFFTHSRLEVFFGLLVHGVPEFHRDSESATITTKDSYSEVVYPMPFVGVVKRSGFVDGGFYYKQGAERGRAVLKNSGAIEGDLVFNETVHEATAVAMFFNLKFARSLFFGEFISIQGSEGGSKTDEGETVIEDYFLMRSVAYFPLGVIGLKAYLNYKPISYSSNKTVTIETIPMTVGRLIAVLGDNENGVYFGAIYGRGTDGQSLVEFNATYEVQAFGATAGFQFLL